jgi:hypothetical protein
MDLVINGYRLSLGCMNDLVEDLVEANALKVVERVVESLDGPPWTAKNTLKGQLRGSTLVELSSLDPRDLGIEGELRVSYPDLGR